MPEDARFIRSMRTACHDLSTPLAVVSGFAKTLIKGPLEPPADHYLQLILDASAQLEELLAELSVLVSIEDGRFNLPRTEVDTLELAHAAAAELEEGRVQVSGIGQTVRVPKEETRRAVRQLARAASRHGGFDSVALGVDGPTLRISPVTRSSAPLLLAEDPKELGPVAATALVRALGGSVEVEEDRLVVRLPIEEV
jgi:signal transduction histidine kinase